MKVAKRNAAARRHLKNENSMYMVSGTFAIMLGDLVAFTACTGIDPITFRIIGGWTIASEMKTGDRLLLCCSIYTRCPYNQKRGTSSVYLDFYEIL